MIVTLIGQGVIYKTKIPNATVGDYWITGEDDKKILDIKGTGINWQISSNNHIKILKADSVTSMDVSKIAQKEKNVIDKIILREYGINYIYIKGLSNNVFVLYCAPTYEDNYIHLKRKNSQDILIGSNIKNDVVYENPLIKGKHARIFFSNGQLMLENFDTNFGTFVNDKPVVNNRKLLFNGDVIFIMGLKIIILGRSIYINNPFQRVGYNDKKFSKVREKEYDYSGLIEEDEDGDLELYTDKDYFARAPRIRNIIEHEKIKIDQPPENQNKEGMPLAMVLGSSLSMGLVSMISMISTLDKISSGESTLKDSVFSLLMTGAMLLTMILIPVVNFQYEKRKKIKNEQTRQDRYKEYINSKIEQIDQVMEKQRNILLDNYISAEECANVIINKEPKLWERKIEDGDFLTVRVGMGDLPLDAEIEYPQKEFTMEDDNLVEILNTVANKSKILKDVPITYSLTEKNVSALIVKNDPRLVEKFVQSIIMQLITLHSYDELKLVFFLKEDKQKNWEHLKTLPHIWNNTKQVRFWAEDYDDMKDISRFLEGELANRKQYEDVDYRSFAPYYVIITDDYKKVENLKIITELLKLKRNLGFSIFCVTDNLLHLPNECEVFINLEGSNGTIFENEISSTGKRQFTFDPSYTFFFEKIGKQLSNIPIKYKTEGKMSLPSTYTFMEMYDVGRIEQLNILKRWKTNDSTRSLQAPIGIDGAGMPIVLDIHEKFHGPHGLIAGSTGSGKSEFIITYILSLAINFHPDDVTMILIDYKGGGLAGAFQKREVKLPHLVGTITNIDKVGLQRSLASIQSELRRRQVIFNEARNKIDEGTIDIYKYQKLYHEGVVSEPIPHLLIICDEFAELKQQQEDFMDELISVARIGRSLGVHLILATQKPAGVVNDQIRSNSKFGICLKVQDREDSMDVIKRPDAAELKKAGQFYMQVGNNEYFTLGQSAWSGAPYVPADVIKKNVDNSIKFISNTGSVIKEVDNSKKATVNSQGEQLTNIVKYMYELAKRENIKAKPLWMENIPETIFLDKVREKYQIRSQNNFIDPVIGEYDDPYNQRQGPVSLNLSEQGNTIIYGNAESGKETFLSTLVYDTMTAYTPEEVQMYILDFGSEALKIFRDSPSVGDVVFSTDTEKIERLFEMLQKEIKSRTAIISEYGGDYKLYIKTSGNVMPMYLIIINNYEAFSENYENEYDDILLTLTREGLKYGIVFVITASNFNDVRYRLSQNFKQKIALQLNNEDDYSNIFDGIRKKRPSHIFGRGLIKLEDIYEFQTARICESENWNTHIKETIENLKKIDDITAKPIPILPKKVTAEDVKEELSDISKVPIGISKKTLDVATYDFTKEFMTLITGKNIDLPTEFVSHILEEFKQLDNVIVNIFDAERILQTGKVNLNLNYKNLILEINNNLKANKQVVCVIIGMDKFLNDLEDGESGFCETLRKAEELGNYTFIIVDNFTKLKNREYNEWYKEFIPGDTGLWIGNGIKDQYLITVNSSHNSDVTSNCGNSFGYIIKQEEPKLVKLLGMKDKGEDNG